MNDPNFDYYYINVMSANIIISNFTMNPNPFTAYSGDKIEAMLKHANAIPNDCHYVRYDPVTESLVFRRPMNPMPYFDDEYKKFPSKNTSWISKFKNLFKK